MIKNTRNQLREIVADTHAYGPRGALLCILRTVACMSAWEFIEYVNHCTDSAEFSGLGAEERFLVTKDPFFVPVADGHNLFQYCLAMRAALVNPCMMDEREMREWINTISEWPSICMVRNDESSKYAIRDTFALWPEVFAVGKDLKGWCAEHGKPYQEGASLFLEVTQ